MNSLGINKEPNNTRVVVAMSGGVDSSTVAVLLKKQGYDVVGITLRLYDYGAVTGKKGACCAGQDIYDAKRVADEHGFPHYILDYESRFKDTVIKDFADSYLRGETPIPCVRCNQEVKFKDLLDTAQDLGADCMATGHYIRREIDSDGNAFLLRAIDPLKDQSYFLFATTQKQIDFLRFPLGNKSKAETRLLAESFGLKIADKPDSQDICFVPDGDYASVVTKIHPNALKRGSIVHCDSGKVLGEHTGIINYTIGQRRGLKLGGGETKGTPLYVVDIDSINNTVVVGSYERLARKKIKLKDINWLDKTILSSRSLPVLVKYRSSMNPVPAEIYIDETNTIVTVTNELQYGISPGQACAYYDGERLLGGGWIVSTAP